jgi:hypothetical protein
VSRVVVLLVALGYGVVRPSLGDDMKKVLYLGGAYLVFSLIYSISISLPGGNKKADDIGYEMLSLVVFILALIDTIFYVWVLNSVSDLIDGLAVRKQAAKYILYRNFRNVLFLSLLSTFTWILYGSIINLNNGLGEDNNWKVRALEERERDKYFNPIPNRIFRPYPNPKLNPN